MWYVVYWKDSGQAFSFGTVLADPMPEEFAVKDIGTEEPDFSKVQWNPQTLALEAL